MKALLINVVRSALLGEDGEERGKIIPLTQTLSRKGRGNFFRFIS